MIVAFEPSFLFVDDHEWIDEYKKDKYLAELLDMLDSISANKMKICWNDILEELLWEYPQKAPWRLDRDLRNKMVPIIHRRFHDSVINLEESINFEACHMYPVINFVETKWHDAFLSIMHYLIHLQKSVYLIVKQEDLTEFTFFCSCYACDLKPISVNESKDLINLEYIYGEWWPRCRTDVDKFNYIIMLYLQKHNMNTINRYVFTEDFIKSIISISNKKERLISHVCKRLSLTEKQACIDITLQDELVECTKERRIRISPRPASTRIHYTYDCNGAIKFLKYYAEGEHDKGL